MCTADLPKNLCGVFYFFLFASSLISGCTSANPIQTFHNEVRRPPDALAININTADAAQLQKLPRVGPRLAEKIIEHRKRYGPFRKVEHLLIVEGVSEERFLELRQFINTE